MERARTEVTEGLRSGQRRCGSSYTGHLIAIWQSMLMLGLTAYSSRCSSGPAPKGQENLAQGLPWVSRYKRFALKGLEIRTRSGSKIRSRFSPYLVAPSGPIRVWAITQGKPWAILSWPFGPKTRPRVNPGDLLSRPLRATDWKCPNSLGPYGAKHIRGVSGTRTPIDS
jgi:hypothetical protein